MSDDRMSFEDACRELGISQAELEQLVAAGELASMKDGEAICFKPEVVKLYKESKGDPMVLLADEDLSLLEGDIEEIDLLGFDDDSAADEVPAVESEAATPAEPVASEQAGVPADVDASGASASAGDSLDDLEEFSLEDDSLSLDDELPEIDLGIEDEEGAAEGDAATVDAAASEEGDDTAPIPEADAAVASSGDEPLLNMDGLLEEEAEATTPVASGADGDDLFGGELGEDTLLDTDLDFGDETDTFDVDAVDDLTADISDEGAILRGGGARVMQMKRKESHALFTSFLAVTGALLLIPLGIVTNTIYLTGGPADGDVPPAPAWVEDSAGIVGGVVEGIADFLKPQ